MERIIKATKYFKNQKPPDVRESGNFIDPYFPPEESSLMAKNSTDHLDQVIKDINVNRIEWKRPKELYGNKNYHLFEDTIDPGDIIQGQISDCYLLSSLASLTEFPQLIYEKYVTKEENDFGYYEMVFFIDGEWQLVFVDDYIPCYKGSKDIYFARPNGTELWVVYLEKAWAKINGGYSNIVFGESLDPLKAFTGYFIESPQVPQSSSSTNEINEIWNKIKIADENDFLICVGTKNEMFVESKGLVRGHAYSLAAARETIYNDNLLRLVRLYNPWGKGEWNGSWSDNSELWTPELEQYFGKETKDDGFFFMEIDDFIRYYDSAYICRMMYGAYLTSFSFEGEEASRPMIFKFNLLEDGVVTFSVLFKHWRFNREKDLRKESTKFSFVLAKYNDKNEIERVWGTTNNENMDIEFVPEDLVTGNYFIWINKIHSSIEDFSYVFRVACVRKYTLEFLGEDLDFNLLHHIIVNKRKRDVLSKTKEVNIKTEKDLSLKNAGIQAYDIINFSKKTQYIKLNKLEMDEKMMKVLFYPKQQEFFLKTNESTCLILAEIDKTNNPTFKISHKILPKEGNSDFIINENKIGEHLSYVQSNRLEKIPYLDIFPNVETLKFCQRFPKLNEQLKKSYSLLDIRKEDEFVYKGLKSILGSINEKEEKFIVKKEFDGTYFGEPQTEFHIGAKKYQDKNSTIYVGHWRSQKWNGQGIIYNQKSGTIIYDGEFERGEMHGKGNQVKENGDIYTGYFSHDKYDGMGYYLSKVTNNIFMGNFINGLKEGVGLEINNSKIMLVRYRDGNYEDSCQVSKEDPEIMKSLKDLGWKLGTSKIDSIKPFVELVIGKTEFIEEQPINYVDKIRERNETRKKINEEISKIQNKCKFGFDILNSQLIEPLLLDNMILDETKYGYYLSLNSKESEISSYFIYVEKLEMFVLKINNKTDISKNYTVVFNREYDIIFEGRLFDDTFMSKYYSKNGEYLEYAPSYPDVIYTWPEFGKWKGAFDPETFSLNGEGLFYQLDSSTLQKVDIKEGNAFFKGKSDSFLLDNINYIKNCFPSFKNNDSVNINYIRSAVEENPELHLIKPQELFENQNYPKNYLNFKDITCEGKAIQIPGELFVEFSDTNTLIKSVTKQFPFSNLFGFQWNKDYCYIGTFNHRFELDGVKNIVDKNNSVALSDLNNKVSSGICLVSTEDEKTIKTEEYFIQNNCTTIISQKLDTFVEDTESELIKFNSLQKSYSHMFKFNLDCLHFLEPCKEFNSLTWGDIHFCDGLYIGKLDLLSRACGQGVIKFNNLSAFEYYIGYWDKNLKHGQGVFLNITKGVCRYVEHLHGKNLKIKSPTIDSLQQIVKSIFNNNENLNSDFETSLKISSVEIEQIKQSYNNVQLLRNILGEFYQIEEPLNRIFQETKYSVKYVQNQQIKNLFYDG